MTSLTTRLTRIFLALLGIAGAVIVGEIFCKLNAGFWVPNAAFLQAIVRGTLDAMFAIGLVLVYRAGRIVNFAQASLGVTGATLFLMLFVLEGWSFWFAFPAAIAAAGATGLVVELMVVRRLSKAPRLALTVVTIGVAQALVGLAGFMPQFFLGEDEQLPGGGLTTPFTRFSFPVDPLVFNGNHIVVVVVGLAVMAGLAAFFRFSSAGIAVRGAAENGDRASLLGINVSNLSSLVWVLAAVLSGFAVILNSMIQTTAFGAGTAGAASAAIMVKGLAAAVIGRMENLPVTAAAAVGIAIFAESMFWAFDTTALINVALLVLIVGILLFQRAKLARTDEGVTGTWAASVEVRNVPHELQDVPTVQAGIRRGLYVLAAIALAYPWVMSPAQTSLGSVYVIYGIVVVSLVVLTGWGGQISLGQFGFVAMGGVIGGSLTSRAGLPFPVALIVASLLGAGLAVLVGLPAMRIKGLFLAVTTLAFSVCVSTVFLSPDFFGWLLPGEIKRPKLLFIDSEDERVYFYLCVAALLSALWVANGLRKSRAGRVLIAMRENERTAQAYAINQIRTRLATFAISGFMAAFAGVLLAHQQHSVRPTAFSPEASITIFLIAVVGGLGSVPGSLVGVAYYAAIKLFVANEFVQNFAVGIGVVLVLLFFPGGLGGLFFQLRDAWLRRVAFRQRIFVPSLVGDYRILDGEFMRVGLAPRDTSSATDDEMPEKYRIPSVIGVRGESQQAPGWRWQ